MLVHGSATRSVNDRGAIGSRAYLANAGRAVDQLSCIDRTVDPVGDLGSNTVTMDVPPWPQVTDEARLFRFRHGVPEILRRWTQPVDRAAPVAALEDKFGDLLA